MDESGLISEFEMNLLDEMEKSLDNIMSIDINEEDKEKGIDIEQIDIKDRLFLLNLPQEIILLILNNLDILTFVNFFKTCRSIYSISTSSYCESIWKKFFMESSKYDNKIDENMTWRENFIYYKKYLETIQVYENEKLIYTYKNNFLKCNKPGISKIYKINLTAPSSLFLNGKYATLKQVNENSFSLLFNSQLCTMNDSSLVIGQHFYSIKKFENEKPPFCTLRKMGSSIRNYKIVGTSIPVIMLYILVLEMMY